MNTVKDLRPLVTGTKDPGKSKPSILTKNGKATFKRGMNSVVLKEAIADLNTELTNRLNQLWSSNKNNSVYFMGQNDSRFKYSNSNATKSITAYFLCLLAKITIDQEQNDDTTDFNALIQGKWLIDRYQFNKNQTKSIHLDHLEPRSQKKVSTLTYYDNLLRQDQVDRLGNMFPVYAPLNISKSNKPIAGLSTSEIYQKGVEKIYQQTSPPDSLLKLELEDSFTSHITNATNVQAVYNKAFEDFLQKREENFFKIIELLINRDLKALS